MAFVQSPPILSNQYLDDRVLRSYLSRVLPHAALAALETPLMELGAHAADAWTDARVRGRVEPRLTHWDAWGERVDRLELTPAWQRGREIATRYGLVATGHDAARGAHARIEQFALVYLYHAASEFYSCPLAMTDGAATAIAANGAAALKDRVLPHLLARDADTFWLSGQWMTETRGGSDVADTETIARRDGDAWRLFGRKWFTSAINAEVAVALARPEGGAAGAEGLALFLVEPRDAEGRWRGVAVDRLKDKLGTRELPTAEIHLDGAHATPIGELRGGVRAVAPVLNVTRAWNAVAAIATMRRALALARDYALRRRVFGRALADQPLHQETFAGLQAEFEGAFHLAFYVAELLGRVQGGQADPAQANLLRLLTPVAKLWTARTAVAIASDVCETFGGAGYLEDTGIPQLLRDAQVLPIWEGTSNVLALDTLRAFHAIGGLTPYLSAQRAILAQVESPELLPCAAAAREAAGRMALWLKACANGAREQLEPGARTLAVGLARTLALSLLTRHAEWALRAERDPRPAAAARRFAARGLFRPVASDARDAGLLATDRVE